MRIETLNNLQKFVEDFQTAIKQECQKFQKKCN